MPAYLFIEELKRIFPESSWPWLVPALRHDLSIWQELQGSFGKQALNELSDNPGAFSPAALCLLALDYPEPATSLQRELIQVVDPAYLRERPGGPQSSLSLYLARIGLLALKFREQRRVTGSWEGLATDLATIPSAALACLYGIVPDPSELVAVITAYQQPMQAVNLILANPMPDKELSERLRGILQTLSAPQRLHIYRYIAAARPRLIPLLLTVAEKENQHASDCRYPTIGAQIEKLDQALYQAEIQQLNGHYKQALSFLEAAFDSTQDLRANLAAQIARAADRTGDLQVCFDAWQTALDIDPGNTRTSGEYSLALLISGKVEEAQTLLAEAASALPANTDPHPVFQFAQARLAYQLEGIEIARKYARHALAALRSEPQLQIDNLPALAQFFIDLQLPNEAVKVIELAIEQTPSNPDLLQQGAGVYLFSGDILRACEAAHLAAAISPERLDLQRCLADYLEMTEDWLAAHEARKTIVGRQSEPEITDLHALATCALQAGRPEEALVACQNALQLEADDGLSHAILAEVEARMGKFDNALEHIHTATQLLPEQAAPWLSLARIYQENDQAHKALEILRAGALSAPTDPAIHLALGETYLASEAPTQALAAFRRAAELAESSDHSPLSKAIAVKVALRLSQTLQQLGHNQDALQVLATAHQSAPANPEIAYRYAQMLQAQDEPQQAISLLKIALRAEPEDISPYLDYARCVTSIKEDIDDELIQQAIPYLRYVLETTPNNGEARALLAEVLAANQEYSAAMEAYRHTMDTGLAKDAAWSVRLNLGLAKVALQIGETEAAIAALQEALQSDSLNPEIHRYLSDAYNAAGLVEDAFQEAQIALGLAPGDLDTLVWFAQRALEMQQHAGLNPDQVQNEALKALGQATQLAPQRVDLIVKLAQLHLQIGDRLAAHTTLLRLIEDDALTANTDTPPLTKILSFRQAASSLIQLEDAPNAVICLEGAVSIYQETCVEDSPVNLNSSANILDILVELADAQYRAGNQAAALRTLDQAITNAPRETFLYIHKAGLLINSQAASEIAKQSVDEALQAITTALEKDPRDPMVHLYAAKAQRLLGNLPAALIHAEKAIELSSQPNQDIHADLRVLAENGKSNLNGNLQPVVADKLSYGEISARVVAAEIATALLDIEQARLYLMSAFPDEATHSQDQFDYYCLLAELSLEQDDTFTATKALTQLMEFAPEKPRTLALQARLAARKSDHPLEYDPARSSWTSLAVDIFDTALETLEQPEQTSDLVQDLADIAIQFPRSDNLLWLALGKAALELRQWELALEFAQQMVDRAPAEPVSHLFLAQTLTLRAEYQRYCQFVQVVRRAPGEHALDEAAIIKYQKAIETAEQQLTLLGDDRLPGHPSGKQVKPNPHLARWQGRGRAVFQPGLQSAQHLAKTSDSPEDTIALIACFGHSGDLLAAGYAGRVFPHHPFVLAQIALVLAEKKPRQALVAAQAAVEALGSKEMPLTIGPAANPRYLGPQDLPTLHALMAAIIHQHRERFRNPTAACYPVLTALNMWPDEPRWHFLAANLLRDQSEPNDPHDLAEILTHLENAVQLDSNYAPPHLELGEIYLRIGASQQAQATLERACQLVPDSDRGWMLLGSAYRANGKLAEARDCAQRALELTPNRLEPNMLLGEIALEEDKPEQAREYAEQVLELTPQHPPALVLLAHALEALDRPDEALEKISQAIPGASEPLPLLIEQVNLYHHIAGLDAALSAIQTLAQNYPNDPDVLTLFATLLEEAGEDEAAIQISQRAIRGFGETGEASAKEQALTHYLLGRLLGKAGQLDQAIHHLSEAIRLDPFSVDAYLELGNVHQQRRQHTQALKTYQQAIAAAPHNPQVYYHAGLALKENKEYVEAEQMLRRASELAPDDVKIHRLLGAVVALNLVHNRPIQPELTSLNAEYAPSHHREVRT